MNENESATTRGVGLEAHVKDMPENRTLPRVRVSGEMIAILAVGVMLAGLVFTTGSWIRDDMQILRDDMRDDMQILRDDMRGDMRILRDEVRSVQSGLSELRERVVRIETLLHGRSGNGSSR